MLKNKEKLKSLLVVLGVYALMAAVAINQLPEKFRLIEDTKKTFNWSIPLKAEFYNESITVMSGGESLSGKVSLDLMEEFDVTASEESVTDISLKLFGIIPVKKVSLSVIPDKKIMPLGDVIGVYMSTEGIIVLGTGKVDGKASPAEGIIKPGDFILEVNNEAVPDKNAFEEILSKCEGEEAKVLIFRNGAEKEVKIKPSPAEDGTYKIGVWVRDSTQGIGTLTYYDPLDNSFGALGHGINDADIDKLMPLKDGKITDVSIVGVKKGKSGEPGELMGVIEKEDVLGDIKANTDCGIYGIMEKVPKGELFPIGLKQDAKEGEAFIITDAVTGENDFYSIEIKQINRYGSSPGKGLVLEVTDERLIDFTNGIVQGMSGSPIIQDGRIIGAVTHVFVRNPLKGYGIFIESMLDAEK